MIKFLLRKLRGISLVFWQLRTFRHDQSPLIFRRAGESLDGLDGLAFSAFRDLALTVYRLF